MTQEEKEIKELGDRIARAVNDVAEFNESETEDLTEAQREERLNKSMSDLRRRLEAEDAQGTHSFNEAATSKEWDFSALKATEIQEHFRIPLQKAEYLAARPNMFKAFAAGLRTNGVKEDQ